MSTDPSVIGAPPPRIEPTVGRVVHFYPGEGDDLFAKADRAPFAAIVCAVAPEPPDILDPTNTPGHRLTLRVFDCDAQGHARNCLLIQPGRPTPERNSWCEWMSFQVKTAETGTRIQNLQQQGEALVRDLERTIQTRDLTPNTVRAAEASELVRQRDCDVEPTARGVPDRSAEPAASAGL